MLRNLMMAIALLLLGTPVGGSETEPDERTIQGRWECVLTRQGTALAPPSDEEAQAQLTIDANTMRRIVVGIPVEMAYRLNASETPKQIDITANDNGRRVSLKGVYVLTESVLIIKLGEPGGVRPTTVDFLPDEKADYLVFGRVAPSSR